MRFDLTVNGEASPVDVAAGTPLLWVLRDALRLTGTKYGCGIGQCGACTVHLDGRPVASCRVTVDSVAGAPITTIEGLATDTDHPVPRAWMAASVVQCGYCQAGQIMAAAALLEATPDPDDGEVAAAMSKILCRCGTYQRIRAAIALAADEMAST